MSRLVRYLDVKDYQCWSRVDLDSGEPVYIGVARTGVIVKNSRLGMFGRTLFKANDIDGLAVVCQNLHKQLAEYTTPPDITHPVLRVFTQTALEAMSAEELSVRLHAAR